MRVHDNPNPGSDRHPCGRALGPKRIYHAGQVTCGTCRAIQVRKLRDSLKAPETASPDEVARARREYADGSNDDIEIDDDAARSESNDGVWIAAWVHLRKEEDEDL